jgi:hypothetical protein
MEGRRLRRNPFFWAAIGTFAVRASLGAILELGIIRVESFSIIHAMGIAGGFLIAVAIPLYSYLKRRTQDKREFLSNAYMLAIYIAFVLVGMHFSMMYATPEKYAPISGTGIVLYTTVASLVVTGFLRQFELAPRFLESWRVAHIGLSISFYIVFIVHVLRGFGVI